MEFKRLRLSNCRIDSSEFDIFLNPDDRPAALISPYPLIVEPHNNSYMVIYGFQKFRSYKNQAYKYIPAYILAEDSYLDKMKTIVEYQRARRTLYPIEIARVISRLESKGIDKKTLATEVADSLGINRGFKLIDRYRSLLHIPGYIVKYLVNKTDSLKIWSRFIDRHEKILKSIIEEMNPTLSELLEIEKNIFEIAKREKKTPDSIAEKYGLFSIIEENSSSSIKKIRRILKKARYPFLTRQRSKINKLIQDIDRPQNIRIKPDQTLETKILEISAMIKDEKDITRLKKFLSENNIIQIKNILKKL